MRLFEFVNYNLSISEEAYILKPFRVLWDRDKSKDKKLAQSELAFIFFTEDFRSDFSDITNEEQRIQEVKQYLELPDKWEEDEFVQEARRFYRQKSEEVLPLLFLKDAKGTVNEIRRFLREVDLQATDKSGKPIYDVNKIATVISKSAEILRTLEDLEEMVKAGMEARQTKGNRDKSPFEDGL